MTYAFATDCMGSTYALINEMRDHATDSSLKQIREHCGEEFESLACRLGYGPDFPIDQDWHVSYHCSIYDGQACFYFVWSGFEYIFTEAA